MNGEQQKNLLEQAVKGYSAALKSFPKLANGMTPDAVKSSPEFIQAKHNFNNAFALLRKVNGR